MTMTALFSRRQPGGIYTIQDMEAHPGVVRFVDASHAAAANALGGGRSPDKPFSTLAYVMTNAATLTPALAAGDVIYVMPGHTETIAAAAGIACATAGVKIIGLGWGASRPTFTWSAVGSTWTITAASVYIKNIRVTATAAATLLFSSSAADLTIDSVDYIEGSGIPLQFLLTTADSDRLTVKNCKHYAVTAGASAQIWIQLVGVDDVDIDSNLFHLALNNASGTYTIRASTAGVRGTIRNNICMQTGGTTQTAVISLVAASTGYVTGNRVAGNITTLAGMVALASAYGSENYTSNTVNLSGIIDPVADT